MVISPPALVWVRAKAKVRHGAAMLHGNALVESLTRRFRTALIEANVGECSYNLLKPANPDDLIREEDFVKDERLPYWHFVADG